MRYKAVESKTDNELLEITEQIVDYSLKTIEPIKTNGYSPEFDDRQMVILDAIRPDKLGAFCTDSFKVLTRNLDKLFRFIEFVLYFNKPFVTSNYYITNGYVERRRKMLKAAHGTDEMKDNMKNYVGISNRHKDIIKSLL